MPANIQELEDDSTAIGKTFRIQLDKITKKRHELKLHFLETIEFSYKRKEMPRVKSYMIECDESSHPVIETLDNEIEVKEILKLSNNVKDHYNISCAKLKKVKKTFNLFKEKNPYEDAEFLLVLNAKRKELEERCKLLMDKSNLLDAMVHNLQVKMYRTYVYETPSK